MKRFSSFLNEVYYTSTSSKKEGMDFAVGGHDSTFHDSQKSRYKHISTTPSGHHVLENETKSSYLFYHPKTKKIDVRLHLFHKNDNKKVSYIDNVSSRNGSSIKAHEAYHHLITHHNKILVSTHQTTGGRHIWKKLSKMSGVNIHGWDEQQNKPVNVTPRHSDDLKRIYDKNDKLHDRKRKALFAHKLVAHKLDEVIDYDSIESKKAGKKTMEKHAFLTGKFRYNPKKDQSDYIGKNYKKIGTIPSTGHEIFHYSEGKYHEFHFHDPKEKGKIDLALATTTKQHENTHNVESIVSRDGSSLKAHVAYHHLMGPRHKIIFTSKAQTSGGQHIWNKLSKMRKVKMHAWDKKEGIKNLHPVHDREEVYQSYEDGKERGMGSVPSHIVAYR